MRHFILVFLLGFVLVANAQEVPPSGEIEDAQIIIEKDKPLTLPKASRIYQRSVVKPVGTDTVNLNFDLSKPDYTFQTSMYTPPVRSFEAESSAIRNYNYVKVGAGNYLSPLLQGFVGHSVGDKSIGLYVFHESFANGPVRDEESAYGRSEVVLSGSLENEGLKLSPVLSYGREGFYFYGHEETGDSIFINDKVGVNHVALNAPVSFTPDEPYAFTFSPKIANTSMAYDGTTFNKEFYLGLGLEGEFQFNDGMSLGLGVGFNHYNYTSGIDQARSLADITPSVLIGNDHGLNLDLGFGLVFGSDSSTTTTKAYFYPDIKASYKISKDLSLFVDLLGGVNATNLNDLRRSNRYLEDSLTLLNEHTKVHLTAGIQYALRPDLVLEPFVGYQLVSNKQLFYPSSSDSSRFMTVYESGNFIETNLGLAVRYMNNKTELVAKMYLSSYQTDSLAEAWYLPATGLDVSYHQQLTEQLMINAKLLILQGLKAPSPVDGAQVDLPTIADLSCGLDYSFSDKFAAFLSVNNLLNIEYERYLNYPTRGIAGKIGFIYRF